MMTEKTSKHDAVKNSHGEPIAADSKGNNVAFICQKCGHPILADGARDEKGRLQDHPAERVKCIRCKADYSLRKDVILVITYEGQAGGQT